MPEMIQADLMPEYCRKRASLIPTAVEIATELCGNPDTNNGDAWTRKFAMATLHELTIPSRE
jgi:hypothetical protein